MAFFKVTGDTLQEKINNLYDKTSDYLDGEDLTFYNPGYLPINPKFADQKYKNFISLYALLVDGINTKDKVLLDISCGRGGGLSIYDQYYDFNDLYGIDINVNNVVFCQQKYPNLNFRIMDLNDIKFADNSFDIITEIDSIFHVEDKKSFLNKINNLLKDGGIFSFADMEIEDFYGIFSNVNKTDITDNIVKSCRDIIDNINNIGLSEKEKDYLLYTAKDNLNVYTVDNAKFFHYTCYK